MKKGIHPNWTHQTQVTCSCGNKFTVGSTEETLQVDICNKCHPFFTGEMKFVDRQGRVDKFLKKMKTAEEIKAKKVQKKPAETSNEDTQSYKDVLRQQQVAMNQLVKARKDKADKPAETKKAEAESAKAETKKAEAKKVEAKPAKSAEAKPTKEA